MVRRIRYLLIKPIKQHFQELLEINCRNVCAFSNQLISLRDRLEFVLISTPLPNCIHCIHRKSMCENTTIGSLNEINAN